MFYQRLLAEEHLEKSPTEIQQELEELQFQVFRMQENMKEISKKHQIIGIDQTKEDKWVIVSSQDDGYQCQIMINDCETAYRGTWDFTLQAKYLEDQTIHIGDIRGPANLGFGSICINHLKDVASLQNIPTITGDIATRDWDHVDRLVHFYTKHEFEVALNSHEKCGEIIWNG